MTIDVVPSILPTPSPTSREFPTMRLFTLLFALCCALAPAQAVPSYPPVRGYDVGFPTDAAYFTTWHHGELALVLAIPGDRDIATVFARNLLPPETRHVEVVIHEFWVYEPRTCAVGNPVFFQETYPGSIVPFGAIQFPGANSFHHPFNLFLSPGDPGFSNWKLEYCDTLGCHDACAQPSRNPLIEAYVITFRFDS